MIRCPLLFFAQAALLLVGCTESNPQPAPAGGADSSVEAADAAADFAVNDVIEEARGDLLVDAGGDSEADPHDLLQEVAPADSEGVPDAPIPDVPCQPQCQGKECGSDGCGGVCGECDEGCVCAAGACQGCGEQLTCQQIYLCVYGCALLEDYEVCPTLCLEGGSAEALTAWNLWVNCLEEEGYVDCVSDHCPGGAGSPGCDQEGLDECTGTSWETCEPALLECAYGDQSCGEVAACVGACKPDDWVCRLLCLAQGTVAAQQAYTALEECTATGGGCPDEWAECGD